MGTAIDALSESLRTLTTGPLLFGFLAVAYLIGIVLSIPLAFVPFGSLVWSLLFVPALAVVGIGGALAVSQTGAVGIDELKTVFSDSYASLLGVYGIYLAVYTVYLLVGVVALFVLVFSGVAIGSETGAEAVVGALSMLSITAIGLFALGLFALSFLLYLLFPIVVVGRAGVTDALRELVAVLRDHPLSVGGFVGIQLLVSFGSSVLYLGPVVAGVLLESMALLLLAVPILVVVTLGVAVWLYAYQEAYYRLLRGVGFLADGRSPFEAVPATTAADADPGWRSEPSDAEWGTEPSDGEMDAR